MSVELDITADGTANLTLSRPTLGNRINLAVLSDMMRAFATLSVDSQIRCLVLRGAGKHFCVGADIDWHGDGAAAAEDGVDMLEMLLALDALPIPVVALVQGGCVGAGVGIAACCDVVLAERGAFFAIPEVRLGFCPGSLLPLFQRAIGARALRRYGLSGERFSAETAWRLGLVSDVFDGGAEDVLRSLLGALRLGAPGAMRETKRLNALRMSVDDMRALEAAFAAAIQSDEATEGLAAFREKRSPAWARETLT